MQIKRLRYIKADIYSYISILMMWIAAFASLYSDSFNKIGLYVALPLAFVLCTLKNKGFHLNIYEKILYGLFAWDSISYLWADDKETASVELHAILGTFLLVYVISILARNSKFLPFLYFTFALLYLSAWNYAVHNILVFMVNSDDRLNDEKLNANTLAYYTFYFTYMSYILSEIVAKRNIKNIWTVVFWLMLPASFGVSLLTASRQVILVQVPLYALLIYIRYLKGVSIKHKISFALLCFICMIAFSSNIINTYNNSYLKQRAETNVGDDPRADLARNAIQEGIANFPLGLGAGNFQSVSITRQISHNSYLESFVNLGLPGLALYVSLLLTFTFRQLKRYKVTKDKMYFVFFSFGLIYILDSFFFVFYNGIWLISFFMLVAAHSEEYYNSKITLSEYEDPTYTSCNA